MDSVLEAMQHQNKHRKQVQEMLMNKIFTKEEKEKMHEKNKNAVLRIFDRLRDRVNEETKGMKVPLMKGEEFKASLVTCLPGGLTLEYALLKKFTLESMKPILFIDHVTEEIKSEWDILAKKYSPTWEEVKSKLPEIEGKKEICEHTCPQCDTMCNREKGHKGKCDSYHQPIGLRGGFWVGGEIDGQLIKNDCQTQVEEGCFMLFTRSCGTKERVSYSDFEKEYPTWMKPASKLPPEHKANGDFSKMIFVKCQSELAQHYSKNECLDLPDTTCESDIQSELKTILAKAYNDVPHTDWESDK